MQHLADLAREEQRREQHADQHALGQVVGGDNDDDGGEHDDARGFRMVRRLPIDHQLKVPIETMIITATSAAIGIRATIGPANTTMTSRTTPAISVDRRPRPPDFTLITDWPIIAQPAMPPSKPAAMLAMPWPVASRFLLLGVSVRSSTICAVIIDSSRPTTASVHENGRMIRASRRFSGTVGPEEDRQAVGQLAHVADRVDVELEADRDRGQHDDADQRRRHRRG